jgi:hypothetical protein
VRSRHQLAIDSTANGDFAVTWEQYDSSITGENFLHTRLYRASGAPATLDQAYRLDRLGSSWDGTPVGIDAAGNFAVAFYAFGNLPNGVSTQWVYLERFAGFNDTRPACARYIATIVGGDGDDVLDGGSNFDFCDGGGHTNADTALSCEQRRNVP